MTRQPTRAELAEQVDRLETSLRRALDRCRSLSILLERAEEDRDTALRRLQVCAEDNALRRQLLAEARAALAELEEGVR